MKQIKEKPERIKGLKEHVRTAPKEVLRRSVNVGAERMKEQLRESRQQEQPEDYASEKIAAVAEGIPSAAVSAAARLRVKKAAEKKRTTVQEEARGAEGRNIAIKTKESCIQYQAPTAAFVHDLPGEKSPHSRSADKLLRCVSQFGELPVCFVPL